MRVFRRPIIVSVGRGLNYAAKTALKHDQGAAEK